MFSTTVYMEKMQRTKLSVTAYSWKYMQFSNALCVIENENSKKRFAAIFRENSPKAVNKQKIMETYCMINKTDIL